LPVVLSSSGSILRTYKYTAYGKRVEIDGGDYNRDGFVDSFDYDDFMACYEDAACTGTRTADVDRNGFVDFFDDDSFVEAYDNDKETAHGGLRTLYAGYERDPGLETTHADGTLNDVYHVRHRVYSTDLGRWTRRDPLGYVDGMSVYDYCNASSLSDVDPTGLTSQPTDLSDPPYTPAFIIPVVIPITITPSTPVVVAACAAPVGFTAACVGAVAIPGLFGYAASEILLDHIAPLVPSPTPIAPPMIPPPPQAPGPQKPRPYDDPCSRAILQKTLLCGDPRWMNILKQRGITPSKVRIPSRACNEKNLCGTRAGEPSSLDRAELCVRLGSLTRANTRCLIARINVTIKCGYKPDPAHEREEERVTKSFVTCFRMLNACCLKNSSREGCNKAIGR
jgi:RHS repeat-associated protein